ASAETRAGAPARGMSGTIGGTIGSSAAVALAGGAMDTPPRLRRNLPFLRPRRAREPLDRPPQPFPAGHGRRPAEPFPGFATIRPPARRVVLWEGEGNEVQRRPDERGEGFGQREQGDVCGVAQV